MFLHKHFNCVGRCKFFDNKLVVDTGKYSLHNSGLGCPGFNLGPPKKEKRVSASKTKQPTKGRTVLFEQGIQRNPDHQG